MRAGDRRRGAGGEGAEEGRVVRRQRLAPKQVPDRLARPRAEPRSGQRRPLRHALVGGEASQAGLRGRPDGRDERLEPAAASVVGHWRDERRKARQPVAADPVQGLYHPREPKKGRALAVSSDVRILQRAVRTGVRADRASPWRSGRTA